MVLPETCVAAVFEAPGRPLRFRRFPLPRDLPPGAVLCRIRLSTICGSDLHTILGRRTEPTPSILGHESVGDVVAVGPDARAWSGEPLEPGDRVSWTITASCGNCFFCEHDLPQKCVRLRKYGHSSIDVEPGITGGYAEYIYLYPGTGIFRVPTDLDDAVVAPANCALATVVGAIDDIGGISRGESVLIAGAGLLGTCLTALSREAGADRVLVADIDPRRADTALRFGADEVFAGNGDPGEVARWARETVGGHGVDVAFEVSGDPRAASAAIDALRIGGRLLVAGLVSPGSVFRIDGNQLTRKCLAIRGIHNYRPEHLGTALEFLAATAAKYPYADLVSPPFPLAEINRAFEQARDTEFARISVRCDDGSARPGVPDSGDQPRMPRLKE